VIHNISHRNIVMTDNIWNVSIGVNQPKRPTEDIVTECNKCGNEIKKKKSNYKPRVGPVDVLVISACTELKKVYGNSCLFTSDEHMIKVARKLGISVHDPEALSRLPF